MTLNDEASVHLYLQKIKNIKVSAIINTYNRYHSLLKAIDSVKNQTHLNIEIIVVNDKSTQKEYYDCEHPPGVIWIDLTTSSRDVYGYAAPGYSKNIAMQHASGDFYAILDDDDVWYPEKSAYQLTKMLSNNWSISCTEAYIGTGPHDFNKTYPLYHTQHYKKFCRKFFTSNYGHWGGSLPTIFGLELIQKHNFVIHSSVMFNKNILKDTGTYNDSLPIHNNKGFPIDWDLWIRVLSFTDIAYIDVPLVYYDGRLAEGKLYNRINRRMKRFFKWV